MFSISKLPKNDWRKVLGVAFGVSLVCSLLVSSVHLLLQPRRTANLEQYQKELFSAFVENIPGLSTSMLSSAIDGMQSKVIDLTTGWYSTDYSTDEVDLQQFSENPTLSIAIPAEADVAGLQRRSNFAPVYILENEGKPEYVILQLMGYGYQSLIKSWIILGSDLNTVQSLTIYEQNETPGLGSRITSESWQKNFEGKQLHDNSGERMLVVVKAGTATDFEVDGITGATRTGNGISNMIGFWFGELGYRRFLEKLKAQG